MIQKQNLRAFSQWNGFASGLARNNFLVVSQFEQVSPKIDVMPAKVGIQIKQNGFRLSPE